MNETFRLGRVAGIRIGVNWTTAITAVLVAYLLAHTYLPHQVAGRNTAIYWLVGVIAGSVFFVSLLAHELAHALAARHEGIRVEGITLWLLGGATRLDGDPTSAAADMRVAAAGPVTSLFLGGLFLGGGFATQVVGAPELVSAPLIWLGWINIFLAVFNLLPASPLDGGRILRAAVWAATGDRTRGTASADRAGVILGWALVAFGALNILAGAGLAGLWLGLIGVFLIAAARSDEQRAYVAHVFRDVRVGDVMEPDPPTVPAWLTLDAVIDRFINNYDHVAYPVTDFSGDVIGLLPRERILRLAPHLRAATRVDSVMTARSVIVTASPEEPLIDLIARMNARSRTNEALVFADGALVGIVSRQDIRDTAMRIRLGLTPRTQKSAAASAA